MASFCYDCYPKIIGGPAEENDMRHPDCPPDHMHCYPCEGCGHKWFDRDGKRVQVVDGN